MNRIALIILKNIVKLPAAYLKLCRYARHPERYTEAEMWEHITYILRLAVDSANVELKVSGTENLPESGGFMLYGNHQGLFDVLAIGYSCPRPLAIVYKQELKEVPLLKQILTCTNSFALDREDVRQSIAVMQAVEKEVKSGRSYVIFPEGTRSKTGNRMNQWHGGSFKCALKAKCPIVPMAFIDCFKVLDTKGSGKVSAQLHYLKPIEYEEYKDLKTVELADLVKSRVQAAIDAHTAE